MRRNGDLIWCLGLFLAACSASPAAEPATVDSKWDDIFTRTSGWNGGDADYSVDLRDGRTLWIFADSFVGPTKDGRRIAGNRMVNNVIGVHPTPKPGDLPAFDSMRFYWGINDKKEPAAWVKPEQPDRWYWPADAAVSGDRLVMTLWRIQRQGKGTGAFDFAHSGGAIGIVENFKQPPEMWQVRQFDNPHATLKDSPTGEIGWGGAVLEREGGWLYIYGVKEDGWNKKLLLARVKGSEAERFDRWEFHAGGGKWTGKLGDAAVICEGVANELRIAPIQREGRTLWTMVHSEPLLGIHVMLRAAFRPEGPWSKPKKVYQVPGVKDQKGLFTYAAKSHPHLSPPGQLLISYVINTGDIWQTLNRGDLYRPRFIRVPYTELPAAPE